MPERSSTTDEVREGAELFERLTGVVIPEYRWPILQRLLGRLGGRSGIPGGMRRLAEGDPIARADLISAATIPETYMFRHSGHFGLLRDLVEERRGKGRATRVLSAGCSTGEEVWSIASVLASVKAPAGERHEVIGWELSASRVKHAAIGFYSNWSCRKGFLEYGEFFDRQDDCFVVDPRLRALASFHQANLFVGDLPPDGIFDVVFFRNVSIYWRTPRLPP
jgi:chemotaxis protein methyltransferase CheR